MITVRNRHGSATVTLPTDREILITRKFDAPAALLFRSYTTPALVKRWWGFETSEWVVCDIIAATASVDRARVRSIIT